jgi:hypothetical protein
VHISLVPLVNRGNAKEIEMTAHEKYLQAMDDHHWARAAYSAAYGKYRTDPVPENKEKNRIEARRCEAAYKEAKAAHRKAYMDKLVEDAQRS